MADIPVALPLRTNIREYEIQELVGSGGFGFVYRAKDHTLQRSVALKEYFPTSIATRGEDGTVKARLDAQADTYKRGLESFLHEARVLARFDDPSVVKVHRFWEQDGTAYMVMPFYDGITLRGLVRRHHNLITPIWLNAFIPRVLDVLERLHDAHTYHRDLSPENILVLESGGVVLLDFGSSRQHAEDVAWTDNVVLKPGYAPIEQYLADGSLQQGPWTDIYGLGAVIYFLLEGKAPPSSINRMQQDPYEPLLNKRDRYPGIPARLLIGIDRCLEVQARDRPQSVAELREMFAITSQTPADFSLYQGVDKVIQYAATGSIAINNENDLTIPLDPITVLSAEIKPIQPLPAAMEQVPNPALEDTIAISPTDPLFKALMLNEPEPPVINPVEKRIAEPTLPVTPKPVLRKKSSVPAFLLGLMAFVLTSAFCLWLYLFVAPPLKNTTQASAEQGVPLKTSPVLGRAKDVVPVPPPVALTEPAMEKQPTIESESLGAKAGAIPDPLTKPAQGPAASSKVEPVAGSDSTAQKAGADAPPVPSPPSTGVVRLTIRPWGTLSVNGRPRGASPPLNQLKLPPGKYQIDIANPGFASYSQEVEVLPGSTTVIKHNFE